MAEALLTIDAVTVRFGGLTAVDGVSATLHTCLLYTSPSPRDS